MTLAWFDLDRMELAWVGVGNVEARLVRGAAAYGARHESALVLGGVVGYNLPSIRTLLPPLTTWSKISAPSAAVRRPALTSR